jgi:N-hydroxyarylamine O-acetyltransferase
MDEARVHAYLSRIGAARPVTADVGTLRELQLRHLLTIPFENLSIHLGERIALEERPLVDKLVRQRRGGFCYELNGAFAGLLSALGFRVTLLAARAHGPAGLGPPFDHLALRVDLREPWLVDVGFGRFSSQPLRLDVRAAQRDPAGTFHVGPTEDGDLDVSLDGEPQYRLDPRPRELSDFEATCWWHRTSPMSHFTRSVVCSLLTESGRVTLHERTLISTERGERRERTLASDAELLAVYRTVFGIELDRVPSASGGG